MAMFAAWGPFILNCHVPKAMGPKTMRLGPSDHGPSCRSMGPLTLDPHPQAALSLPPGPVSTDTSSCVWWVGAVTVHLRDVLARIRRHD